jgi:hypothetical protein
MHRFQPLNLSRDFLLSKLAFKFNLYRYISVYPAAELPQLARRHNPGAPLIEINAVHAARGGTRRIIMFVITTVEYYNTVVRNVTRT